MPETEKKAEQKLERRVEARVEKDVEKKVEKKIEKDVEAKVEKDLEKKWRFKNNPACKECPKTEVGILIQDYGFLFSDFDTRPLAQRAISDDFLREVRKFTFEETPGSAELRFLVPKNQRSSNSEAIIKKRLRDHFKKHADEFERERKGIVRKDFFMFFAGLGMSALAAILIFYFYEKSIVSAILVSLLEPAGWFVFWTGLDELLNAAKTISPELDFYKRMSKAEIKFDSY